VVAVSNDPPKELTLKDIDFELVRAEKQRLAMAAEQTAVKSKLKAYQLRTDSGFLSLVAVILCLQDPGYVTVSLGIVSGLAAFVMHRVAAFQIRQIEEHLAERIGEIFESGHDAWRDPD